MFDNNGTLRYDQPQILSFPCMNSFGDVFDCKACKDDGEQNWDDSFNATCSFLGGESPPHTSTEYE